MNFKTYQDVSNSTNKYPKELKLLSLILGLTSESGEVADKVKKAIRDENFNGQFCSEKLKQDLILELGDCLWYISALATYLDVDLSLIAEKNINKLKSRIERGKLSGSGDYR